MKPVSRILFIERKLNPTGGGVQRVSYTLGEKFRTEGYQVWYAFYVKETDTKLIPNELKLQYDTEKSLEDIYTLFRSFVKGHEIDTLIVQNVYTKKFCRIYNMLKAELGVNIICCLHENPDRTICKDKWGMVFPKVYFRNKLMALKKTLLGDNYVAEMKRAYALSDRYVLLSERFIPVWKNINKVKGSEKLVGINNPCSMPNSSRQVQKENFILVVGRMEESQKRISNILMVWSKLWQEYLGWKLIIVGDGPDLPRYKRYAAEKKLGNVSFEGASNNVQEYYEKSKIFLMTSIWEGFGMTLIEAQNAGCVPVVFDNFAALHDIVDGTNGIAVRSNDIMTFVETVDNLMEHEDRLNDMAANAMRSAKEKFSIEVICQYWLKMFENLGRTQ